MPPHCPPDELLGEFLADRLSPTNEDDLETHLRSCGDCRNRLDRLTAVSAITPHIANPVHSPLAPEFAQRLEDSLRDSLHSNGDEWDQALPEIPGYELLEAIGRGGSSIVFRARDEKLQRIVAIKVLRERANRIDRERFHRETQALAALRHPNITRAHGAGETNDHLYLVMEHIAGGALGRFIAGRPQDPLASARLTRQLAGAMRAAHAAGFVHRDLKPSNILLDAHFGQAESSGLDRFVPKVTDLGIVKDLSRDDGFTQTRDCLGTPSYMAPEQVKGSAQAVDCRTDVYALGAVLYELLAGRPPFRAGSPLDTMLQVKHEEPVPPSRFQPKLPRDLETICLTCLEKDPSQRYQSAQLLANDLDRLLQRKPILARRTGWIGKLWRWSRRNPGWATAALVAGGLLLAFAIGGPIVAKREHELRKQAREQERLAQAERALARDHAELASQALESTLTQLLRSSRLQDSALDEVRASLIRGAVPYYEQLVQKDDADTSVRQRQGRMLLQLAAVHAKEQQPDKARAAYNRSLEILDALNTNAATADRPTKSGLSIAHQEYGRFLQLTDRDIAGAERHYRLALALRMETLAQSPNDAGLRDDAAIALSLLGTLAMPRPERADEARELLTKASSIRDSLVADFPERDDLRHYAAMAHLNLGLLQRQLNNNTEEIREFQTGWVQQKEMKNSASVSPESPYYLSTLEGEFGVALARAGQRGPAIDRVKSALRTAEALEAIYPAVAKYTELRQQWQEVLDVLNKQ